MDRGDLLDKDNNYNSSVSQPPPPLPPPPHQLTIERLNEKEELILAQTTSQFCRYCFCQPSINWVIAEQDNFEPGQNPFDLNSSGWIHEESSFCGRSFSWTCPGCRSQKYIQHAGPPPESIMQENQGCCCCLVCQTGPTTAGLKDHERDRNVIATHEKSYTCGIWNLVAIPFPICNCFPLPYLDTKNGTDGTNLGRTSYVCDHRICVPKYDVTNSRGEKIYRIQPDTCCLDMCIRCRCDSGRGDTKGKCCRVPFIIRNPRTLAPATTDGNESFAQVDALWSGWANECCRKKSAYHLAFPREATVEEKLILTGSAILIDVNIFEQDSDN